MEALLSPNLIIVGGGISKESDKWVPRLTGIRARIVPAALLNDAGIVGAAMATSSAAAPIPRAPDGPLGHGGYPAHRPAADQLAVWLVTADRVSGPGGRRRAGRS